MSVDCLAQDNTILIVDDTPTNLQVLFDLLSEQGYRVAIAKNGETALQRLQISQPNLILLDVMMPGIDGFETCQRLKANPDTSKIPVIFMTALSDSVDKVKGLRLGAVDYITKPIQHEEVLARIQVHLELRHATRIVEQRTEELNQALESLKQAQQHLVQGEKMSALGQLVAGIAHEINNPVNFIHGNLTYVKEYTQDLLEFVQLYQKNYPHPVEEIQARAKNLELEFLQEDLLKMLGSMEIGSERIRQLVLSLRNFSRLDESEFKAVDIHAGMNSTLVILQHRLKAKSNFPAIQVIKDYAQLPEVECYPSQLNQVFMNILSNAIDALEESNITTPTITIRTSVIDTDWVRVSIADNGVGIPESICSQLFNPFFTTKPVGKGTGLGLSISYQIITEKHNGKIECRSTVGQGTEFVVQIPLQQIMAHIA
ncbi:response regulator receiver sensor signal transduction histidine kinase (plasmid) [Nostoc sp. NIES-3756]|uniref:sensor histidine kinase n=1 Tax=Nostoc sp. NIES-3756 TaxID=1751286 RepID=UPI0007217CCB|nr:response regulator [Nostoc sp. NIES-3756]BAT56670.1 response regulator receiver sensor signal transduction histidine kinase [Nostoc sp. NIES-3756]BAY41656.1 response regulator receiver sensor signal transduction histidine kinase [Nostoc sp. NIES-2111]